MSSMLNDKQHHVISEDFHIEHIVPQKWDHYKYNGWDESSYNRYHESLGNLVPLEKILNIKSSHRFFEEKKLYYLQSNIQDVLDLSELRTWEPNNCKERNEIIKNRLANFMSDWL